MRNAMDTIFNILSDFWTRRRRGFSISTCTKDLSFDAKCDPCQKCQWQLENLVDTSELPQNEENMSQSVRIIQKAGRHFGGPVADIPAFLCPGILRIALQPRRQSTPCEHQPKPPVRASQRRFISSITPDSPAGKAEPSRIPVLNKLPQQCAGCGAFTQTVDEKGAGYFTLTRGSVKNYLGSQTTSRLSEEEAIVKQALEAAGSAIESVKLGDFSAPGTFSKTFTFDNH